MMTCAETTELKAKEVVTLKEVVQLELQNARVTLTEWKNRSTELVQMATTLKAKLVQ